MQCRCKQWKVMEWNQVLPKFPVDLDVKGLLMPPLSSVLYSNYSWGRWQERTGVWPAALFSKARHSVAMRQSHWAAARVGTWKWQGFLFTFTFHFVVVLKAGSIQNLPPLQQKTKSNTSSPTIRWRAIRQTVLDSYRDIGPWHGSSSDTCPYRPPSCWSGRENFKNLHWLRSKLLSLKINLSLCVVEEAMSGPRQSDFHRVWLSNEPIGSCVEALLSSLALPAVAAS